MLPEEYINASNNERRAWINTLKIETGLQYFGGKSGPLGREIIKAILDTQAYCITHNKRKRVFIDAFTGGGKIALSMPEGWFDEIIMNDLDYSVISYYLCCKDYPEELKAIVETYLVPEILENRATKNDKSFGYILFEALKHGELAANDMYIDTKTYNYNMLKSLKEKNNHNLMLRQAFTVAFKTEYGFTSETGKNASYTIEGKNPSEKIALINSKRKSILSKIDNIHEIMIRKNITIMRDDYARILRQYNDEETLKNEAGRDDLKKLDNKNEILFYFDPPYHPLTLSGQKEAGYACTFDRKMCLEIVDEMLKMCAKNSDVAFVFSNYNPENYKKELTTVNTNLCLNEEDAVIIDKLYENNYKSIIDRINNEDTKESTGTKVDKYQDIKTDLINGKLSYLDFIRLEEISAKYYLGGFQRLDSDAAMGNEWVWIRPDYTEKRKGVRYN